MTYPHITQDWINGMISCYEYDLKQGENLSFDAAGLEDKYRLSRACYAIKKRRLSYSPFLLNKIAPELRPHLIQFIIELKFENPK